MIDLSKHFLGEEQVFYASKAWGCMAVSAIVNNEGLGIDVVSAGEILTAMRAGTPADLIYFHGNNKSLDELRYALDAGCTIVVDNWYELNNLNQLALEQTSNPRIMRRLTPGIECHTHEYIQTGKIDSKFGFEPNEIEAVLDLGNTVRLTLVGYNDLIGLMYFAF